MRRREAPSVVENSAKNTTIWDRLELPLPGSEDHQSLMNAEDFW
jgi:hypothetical protein